MPTRAKRACGLCANLHPCPVHPPRLGRWSSSTHSAQRDTAQARAWRDAVLERDACCADPFKRHPLERRMSVVADHVVPLAHGGARYELANGQGLCKPCHDTKTGREGQARQ